MISYAEVLLPAVDARKMSYATLATAPPVPVYEYRTVDGIVEIAEMRLGVKMRLAFAKLLTLLRVGG